jgi:acyl-CoA thioesterase FadM
MNVGEESVLTFRVWPNDVDITKITNDRFIALMDLGRMDIAFRVGLIKTMMKKSWVPLATFDTIRFRYPLKLFQKYRLHTRIIYWDAHTFYFHQKFVRKNRIVASGYVSATLLGPKGHIHPEDILKELGHSIAAPEKPAVVSKLQEMDTFIHQQQIEQ